MYVGVTKLLWHRLSINPQKLQVLKKSERSFPFAPKSSDGSSSGSCGGGGGGGSGGGGGGGGGGESQPPVLVLDEAVKDIQRQIEMLLCKEQQPQQEPIRQSQPPQPQPQQQQQRNIGSVNNLDRGKGLDKDKDKDKGSNQALGVLKSLRRLTLLCRDLLPGRHNTT